jgi:uncharacterized protein YyaL (SSP411 family)
VAAQVLLRLGHLLGNVHYLDAAEHTLKALYASVSQYPSAHNSLLLAIEEYLHPPQLIVLRGEEEELRRWTERCRQYYAPGRLAFTIPDSVKNLPGALAGRSAKAVATAYICTGHTCSAPIIDFAQFNQELKPAEVVAR